MTGNTIFAFGSGRSGTTLLAKLIDSSEAILYRHEPDKNSPSTEIPFWPNADQHADLAPLTRDYLKQITKDRAVSVSGKEPIFDKRFRSSLSTTLIRGMIPLCGAVGKVGIQLPVPDLARDNDYQVLIKSVSSLGRVPLFSHAAPEMKFIHIVRHPGAVVSSLLRGVEEGKMQKNVFLQEAARLSNSQRFDIDVDALAQASFEEQSAYTWMCMNDHTFQAMQGKPNYLLISYEDLCVNLNARVTELCQFIGIEYDQQMHGFVDSLLQSDKQSGYFSVTKNPLANINKWENTLAPDIAKKMTSILNQSDIGRFVIEKYEAATQAIPKQAN